MTIEEFSPSGVRLFRYLVASADMYYAEQQQRDVLLGRDPRGHVRIWGMDPDGGPSSSIELCQVFLEYALYCSTWCAADEALFHMQDFGETLGRGLADYLHANPDLLARDDPLLRALQQVFDGMGADCIELHLESGVRFLASHCQLEEAAERSGLCHRDLAHHGISALCRALILSLDPRLLVESAPDTIPEFVFTVTAPAFA